MRSLSLAYNFGDIKPFLINGKTRWGNPQEPLQILFKEVYNILKDIKVFLIIKREQSEILMKFISNGKKKTGVSQTFDVKKRTTNQKYNSKIETKRELLYKKIRELNKTGIGLAETK